MLYCPHFRWTGFLAGHQIHINLLQCLIQACFYSGWKSWVVLNNAGLIGYVLQLISIKSLGDCHLSLGGQGAGAGAMYLSQPLIRKHTFACFAKGRGQGGGADTISAPERYNCRSVNCCRKMPCLWNSAKTHGEALFKGYNEGPSVSLCKQKSKTWETYLAWFHYGRKPNTLTQDSIPFFHFYFQIIDNRPTIAHLETSNLILQHLGEKSIRNHDCSLEGKHNLLHQVSPSPLVLTCESCAVPWHQWENQLAFGILFVLHCTLVWGQTRTR